MVTARAGGTGDSALHLLPQILLLESGTRIVQGFQVGSILAPHGVQTGLSSHLIAHVHNLARF